MNSRKQERLDIIEALTEALFQLLDHKPIENITIIELINKAGISRGTYYNLYGSKEEIISNFIDNVIEAFRDEVKVESIDQLYSKKHQKEVFMYAMRYAKSIETLKKAKLDLIFLDRLNHYLLSIGLNHSIEDELRLYALAGMEYNLLFNMYTHNKVELKNRLEQNFGKFDYYQ